MCHLYLYICIYKSLLVGVSTLFVVISIYHLQLVGWRKKRTRSSSLTTVIARKKSFLFSLSLSLFYSCFVLPLFFFVACLWWIETYRRESTIIELEKRRERKNDKEYCVQWSWQHTFYAWTTMDVSMSVTYALNLSQSSSKWLLISWYSPSFFLLTNERQDILRHMTRQVQTWLRRLFDVLSNDYLEEIRVKRNSSTVFVLSLFRNYCRKEKCHWEIFSFFVKRWKPQLFDSLFRSRLTGKTMKDTLFSKWETSFRCMPSNYHIQIVFSASSRSILKITHCVRSFFLTINDKEYTSI